MPRLAVTALGPDQPGLIARLSGLLHQAQADVGDAVATTLGGHAAIALVIDAPEAVDSEVLQRDLADETADLALAVTVHAPAPGSPSLPATHVLRVHGPDRPGLVHEVAALVAERGVNVTDLAGRPLRGEEPVYALQLEIATTEPGDAADLAAALRSRVPDVSADVEALDAATF